MDSRLLKKAIDLLYFLAFDYLASAFVYDGGHPVAAGIVAAVLVIGSVFSVFADKKFSVPDFPESTLALDVLFMVLAVLYIFMADAERDYLFLPVMVLGFAGSFLDVVRMFKSGEFRGKTFREFFDDHLRLPVWLDLIFLFWPIYSGFTDGWDTLGGIGYVSMVLLTLDLIHNVVIIPSTIRREKERYSEYLQELEKEKEALASVDTDAPVFDEEARQLLLERIDLIDRILIGRMSGNAVFSRKAEKEVEKVVADRSSFIESLALHFAVSHPQVIEQLQQHGLSRYEIGLCCLYYMGYSGKEVKDISDTSMVYHVNSAIRQKLGLNTNDVNLSTYIRDLFASA